MLLIRLVLVFPILRLLHLSRPIHLFPSFWVNGCSSKTLQPLESNKRQERLVSRKQWFVSGIAYWKKPLRSCLEGQMDHEFLIGQGARLRPVDQIFHHAWNCKVRNWREDPDGIRSKNRITRCLHSRRGWCFQILVHH